MKLFEDDRETKAFIIGFTSSVLAGVITLYVFYEYISKRVISRTIEEYVKQRKYQQSNMYYQSEVINDMQSNINLPKLSYEIVTSELDDVNNKWIPVLKHTFYGNTEDEIIGLIKSHKQTDSFFRASFEGVFNWKGGTIKLKNDEIKLLV